jgi:CDGSH-type Zn-finger protein
MNPIILELKEGSYYWCSCERSKSQPFCDGSHQDTKFNPLEFKIPAAKKVAICNCKHTKTAPFCDGAHKNPKG